MNFLGVILVSFLNTLTTIVMAMPYNAVLSILKPWNKKKTMATIGNRRCIFLRTTALSGIWSFDSPSNPKRFASKWVIIQMPEKYKIAGMVAAFAISQYPTPANSIMRNAAAPMIGGII